MAAAKQQYQDLQQSILNLNTQKNNLNQELKNIEEQNNATLVLYNQDLERQKEKLNASLLVEEEKIQNQLVRIREEEEKAQNELNKIKNSLTAGVQARLREQEVKEKRDFYCIQLKQNDLDDINLLETIKEKLHNPRILSMLIWQTYYQKPMTNLCNNILGSGNKCGIYKITNLKTEQVYIGQSVHIPDRWKEHAKCGLGIDTPAGNKLYKAMREYGLYNFSFELLEECKKEELNEKEALWIDMYQSNKYGYNITKGNNA